MLVTETKSKYHYVYVFFIIGFSLSLIGTTVEDYFRQISIGNSIKDINHFISPLIFGIIFGFIGYLYWNRRNKQINISNQYTANLQSLLDVNQAFISTIDLSQILQIIIDKSTYLINLDTGAIYLHEDEKLYLGATTPPLPDNFPDLLRYDLLANHPHIQQSLKNKKPVVIVDTSKTQLSEAEQIVVKSRNLLSILYIPLIIDNEPVGTLILGTTKNKREFTNQEVDVYSTFSSQAALAIENARLYKKSLAIAEELRQQNEEFLTLNEELSESYEKIKKINEDLRVAVAKAEESDRLKTSFLQNMSHEIRTPLNAIVGFSKMISDQNLPMEKIKQFSEVITNSSNTLNEIINDVIEISRIQSSSSLLVEHEFDIVKIIRDVLIDIRRKAEKKKIVVDVQSNILEDQYFIVSDNNKLSNILRHLLDNAVKFTDKGEIILNISIYGQTLTFEVVDRGIGIPKSMHELVFEPFRQIEIGTARKYGGNGLGLAIVKACVEQLGGTIDLDSDLGIGTKVMVSIPFK